MVEEKRIRPYKVTLELRSRDGLAWYEHVVVDDTHQATAAWKVAERRMEEGTGFNPENIFCRVKRVDTLDGMEPPWYPEVHIDALAVHQRREHDCGRGVLRENLEKEREKKDARREWITHVHRRGRKIEAEK